MYWAYFLTACLMLRLFFPENLYLGTKSDYVVQAIRIAILVGDTLPGTRITQQQVRDILKVTSSPVREAFNQHETEGLLTRNRPIGTRMTSMDIEDAKEFYVIQSLYGNMEGDREGAFHWLHFSDEQTFQRTRYD